MGRDGGTARQAVCFARKLGTNVYFSFLPPSPTPPSSACTIGDTPCSLNTTTANTVVPPTNSRKNVSLLVLKRLHKCSRETIYFRSVKGENKSKHARPGSGSLYQRGHIWCIAWDETQRLPDGNLLLQVPDDAHNRDVADFFGPACRDGSLDMSAKTHK